MSDKYKDVFIFCNFKMDFFSIHHFSLTAPTHE